MSTNNSPESPQRRRFSTRLGIALIVALVVIVIAIVWGVQRWDDEEMEGPSVFQPGPVTAMAEPLAPAA